MFIEAQELLQREFQSYDVCIVGAGPAGISLAHSLSRSGLRTCVIESGDQKAERRADSLRALESNGIEIREDSRERVLGGASTTWTGLSSPLDEIDLRPRAWVPYSGWPIDKDELIPYYQAASLRFRFPAWPLFIDTSWLPDARGRVPIWEGLEEKAFLATDPPQNFGLEFASPFKEATIDLVLGATVTNLEGDDSNGEVRGVRLALPSGATLTLHAQAVVLACGGIENARVLLNSSFACPEGLGNDRDQVGRYFMNHPKGNFGVIELGNPAPPLPGYFGFLAFDSGYEGYVGLRLSETAQEREEVLNSYVRFEPIFDWSDNPGVAIAAHYIKRARAQIRGFGTVKTRKIIGSDPCGETGDESNMPKGQEDLAQHLRALREFVRHSGAVTRHTWSRLTRWTQPKVTAIRLRNFLEMAPDPSNRITLSDRSDAFGIRLPRVSHRCYELDRRSIVTLHRVLGTEVQKAGWGRLHSDLEVATEPWPVNNDSSHHMGATRMGTNPATSVVNSDCRLHTTRNVYLAGASVFPTSGCANPTYTIVALAIRLGDHLKRAIRTARVQVSVGPKVAK